MLRTVPALVDNALGAGDDVPMYVRGMHLTGRTNVDATVDGDAEARKYRSFVKGDRLTYDQDSDEVVARGNARLSQGAICSSAPRRICTPVRATAIC